MSQVDLAERLGNTQTLVSKCERGERRIDAVELVEFAEAMKHRPAGPSLFDAPQSAAPVAPLTPSMPAPMSR